MSAPRLRRSVNDGADEDGAGGLRASPPGSAAPRDLQHRVVVRGCCARQLERGERRGDFIRERRRARPRGGKVPEDRVDGGEERLRRLSAGAGSHRVTLHVLAKSQEVALLLVEADPRKLEG